MNNPLMNLYEVDQSLYARFPLTHSWELTAAAMSKRPSELFQEALYNPISFMVLNVKGTGAAPNQYVSKVMIPGHRWVTGRTYGPQPCQVMIIGKRPGQEEVFKCKNLTGASGEELSRVFKLYDIDTTDFYVTNVVRYLPPDGGKVLKADHIRDCAPLLAAELEFVRPQFILLLGADAVKFMFGKRVSLTSIRGAELPFLPHELGRLPSFDHTDPDFNEFHSMQATKVIATVNPAQILREPSLAAGFTEDIKRFSELVVGKRSKIVCAPGKAADEHYQYIYKLADLNMLVSWLIADKYKLISIDCEWGGEDHRTGQLRTIQFSWQHGYSAVVVLRKAGGAWAFDSDQLAIVAELKRLFDRNEVLLVGHMFRADSPWLEDIGVPVMRHLAFDTLLADHLLNESADHTLSPGLSTRYTSMGRYDFELEMWAKANPSAVGGHRGYMHVPDEILLPYAAADADCTLRCAKVLIQKLSEPHNARVYNLFCTVSVPVNQPIYEMETTGILADTDRMVSMLWRYVDRKQQLLAELQAAVHNPSFNPRSYKQKTELLFAATEKGGLGLRPIKTTGKPSQEWSRVATLPPAQRASARPAVDAEVLDLLIADTTDERIRNILTLLENFQIIDQMTKNFLKPPIAGEEAIRQYSRDVYVEGLIGFVGADGRIRTRISQTKETGRFGSSKPNMQNLSKRQEAKYKRIMGKDIPSLRSCFVAEEGHVLVESDIKSAEVVALAYVSGDRQLIEDALGPIKLHAKVAVDVLGAQCDYSEVAEKYPDLYVSAKNINFGIPYQRGAKAIARQVNREIGKLEMTEQIAQELIIAWYNRYPRVREYVEFCKQCVRTEPHYIENAYGRRRHFTLSEDESVNAAQEREAVNFPIQSLVADALSNALINLWRYKQENPWCSYKILLAIHDAVLLSVPIPILEHVMDVVLPLCMIKMVLVPYHNFRFNIDPEIYLRWGEKPTAENLKEVNVPEKYWPKK